MGTPRRPSPGFQPHILSDGTAPREIGFDPTNCLLAGDRHIRTAVGRDYADVTPTRGIFRGQTSSEFSVAVRVTASAEPPELEHGLPVPEDCSLLVKRRRNHNRSPPRTCNRSKSSNRNHLIEAGSPPSPPFDQIGIPRE